MNDKELQYLLTIAETKSLTKAANKLFISQPSLSQTLQKIEDELGVKLFNRTQEGMMLTYAGELYYRTAKDIISKYSDLAREINNLNDMQCGKISVGTTSFLATYILPIVIPEYRKALPNVEIVLIEESSIELERLLIKGEIDLSLMHIPPKKSSRFLRYEPLLNDPFVLVTKRDYPVNEHMIVDHSTLYPTVDISAFSNEQFILMRKGTVIRQIEDSILEKAMVNPYIVLTLTNFETIRRLSSIGMGVSLLPLQYTKMFKGDFPADYYMLEDIYKPYWTTCTATNTQMYIPKSAHIFMDIVRSFCKI